MLVETSVRRLSCVTKPLPRDIVRLTAKTSEVDDVRRPAREMGAQAVAISDALLSRRTDVSSKGAARSVGEGECEPIESEEHRIE